MSTDTSSPRSRTEDREMARHRLSWLEIEMHRVKAELARLEAEEEDAAADRLAGLLDGTTSSAASSETASPRPSEQATSVILNKKTPAEWSRIPQAISPFPPPQPRKKISARRMPAWMVSLLFHIVILVPFGWMSFVTLSNDSVMLMASPTHALDEDFEEVHEIEMEPIEWEENVLDEMPSENLEMEADSDLFSDLSLAVYNSPIEVDGLAGLTDSLPSDIGTLMIGEMNNAPRGGERRKGGASFFGKPSQGNRFVFIIDNSSSMKKGRLEAAISELIQSVDSMSRRQSFFVIFVSDQTYPIFYPTPPSDLLPATTTNKRQLKAWLGTVEIFGGKGIVLIDAFQQAAALRPDVVYFLWDGVFGGPKSGGSKTEQKVMTHLTGSPWGFTVHTLGMGVPNQHCQQLLEAIARAHGGQYVSVSVAR